MVFHWVAAEVEGANEEELGFISAFEFASVGLPGLVVWAGDEVD